MHFIYIFSTNDFIKIDVSNIATLLHRISFFIRNKNLNSKTEKNTLHITRFGQIAWNLISFIYKAEWDKLMVNSNNKTFKQCVLA